MRSIIILILVVLTHPIKSQSRNDAAPAEKPPIIVRISLVSPKLVMDFAPSDHFTLTAGFWFKPQWWTKDDTGDREFHPVPGLNPRITFEPRYFFNQDYRQRTGKRTDFYSGWYVGLPFYLEFPKQKYNTGTTMGFQCTFGTRWYWNVEAGPGFTLQDGAFKMTGSGDVSFGLVLN